MQYNGHSDNEDIVSFIVIATGLHPTAGVNEIIRAPKEPNRC